MIVKYSKLYFVFNFFISLHYNFFNSFNTFLLFIVLKIYMNIIKKKFYIYKNKTK